MKLSTLCFSLLTTLSISASAQPTSATAIEISNSELTDVFQLYRQLHQAPELSYHEVQTSKRLAKKLKTLGFDVTEGIGGHGVVALYKNGEGPTLMIRADTDALPIVEETKVDYASTVKVKDANGNMVGVMHGCGHDIHMASFIGTAQQLIKNKAKWQGTLMMVAQPAEEVGAGAKHMLKDGLFSKFALPDYVIGLHVSAALPAGTVGLVSGYTLANVDSVDITVKGKGGHGAYPHSTIDPIVLASRLVLALQTIPSREISPLEPNVITVGSIQGGSKHNIISNEVKLQLTLRSYNPAVRNQQIEKIKRIANGIAMSAGLPRSLYPEVYVHEEESIPSTYNTPELVSKVKASISNVLGEQNVKMTEPVMAGEDFGLYGRTENNVPITIFWLGGVTAEAYQQSITQGIVLPSLHSSKFIPDYKVSLPTGIKAMTQSAMDLLQR